MVDKYVYIWLSLVPWNHEPLSSLRFLSKKLFTEVTLRGVHDYAGSFSASDSRWSGFDSGKRQILQRQLDRLLFQQAMAPSALLGWLYLRRHTFLSGAAVGFSSVYPTFIFCFFICFLSLFLASMSSHRFSLSFDLHRNRSSFPYYGIGSSSVLLESIKMICCGLGVSDDLDRFPSTKSLSSLMWWHLAFFCLCRC